MVDASDHVFMGQPACGISFGDRADRSIYPGEGFGGKAGYTIMGKNGGPDSRAVTRWRDLLCRCASQPQWHQAVYVSICDAAVPCDAGLYCRMVLAQLPRSQVYSI